MPLVIFRMIIYFEFFTMKKTIFCCLIKFCFEKNKLNFYQLSRNYFGISINNFLKFWLKMSIRDTQAGLKGFIKPKNFSKIKFISKRFFFDLELILLFIFAKKKILSLKTTYNVAIDSNISFFNFKKNFETLFELIKICIYYK